MFKKDVMMCVCVKDTCTHIFTLRRLHVSARNGEKPF